MSELDYDPDWTPGEAAELEQAAKRLEEFAPEADVTPRTAFLLSRWLRSYAADITRKARADRRTPDIDEHALALARHINGDTP